MSSIQLLPIPAIHLYTKANVDPNYCVYCGGVARELDHVLPISLALALPYEPWPANILQLVPCCVRCNRIARARLFKSFAAKRNYIRSRLRDIILADLSSASICELCLAVKLETRE